MESILSSAIQSVQQADLAFSKYITANDTGATGGHQAGFHIHKQAWPLFFDEQGTKGTNKDRYITIKWQGDFETDSRFIYYGTGTRNEYRLTRFGKGFPYLQDENIGDLLVICRKGADYYEAFVLQSDEDIDEFFAALNISTGDTNGLVPKQFEQTAEEKLYQCFMGLLKALKEEFPTTVELAANARNCYNGSYNISQGTIKANPDREILNWLNAEFQLFKIIENDRYNHRIKTPFKTVEELVDTANTILNRRKSRAGKSLEHHLAEVFKISGLQFAAQTVTEDKKKPDFIFPDIGSYLNPKFDKDKLVVLASKTTCKDRWRQILNEADRVKTKHLFTLQQGISTNQLTEMYKYDVCLVVPAQYMTCFPPEFRQRILTLGGFIEHVNIRQH
jgi:EcoRII C terminal/Restriction endonuclease EcoRII, N-terminal